MKKLILICLVLLGSMPVFSQIVPQWKAVTSGLMSYYYPGKTPNGFDTLWNAKTIRTQIASASNYSNGTGILLSAKTFSLDVNYTNSLYVQLSGTYANPSWISSLAYTKLTGAPVNISSFTNDANYINAAGARSVISATGSLSYNPTTGILNYVQPINISAFTNDVGYLGEIGNYAIQQASYKATANGGNGYYDVVSQTISPASSAGHVRIYSDSLNRLSWKTSTYRRTIRVTRPSDQTISMPYKFNPIISDSTDVFTAISLKQAAIISALPVQTTTRPAVGDSVNKAIAKIVFRGDSLASGIGTRLLKTDTTTAFANLLHINGTQTANGNYTFAKSVAFNGQVQTNTLRLLNSNLVLASTANAIFGSLFNSTGNLLLQNAGTQTDLGYKLAINSAGTNGVLYLGIGKIAVTEGTNGRVGQATLVAGAATITISGLTTSSRAFTQLVSIGGTVTTTWHYKAVCTANTLTITAITNTGTTDTTDTSVLSYMVIN